MRRLTKEGQELTREFAKHYGKEGCSCYPPCLGCLHPGNPLNLAESEDLWEVVEE